MIDLGKHKIKPMIKNLKRKKSDDSLTTVMTGLSKISSVSGMSGKVLKSFHENKLIIQAV